MDLSTTYLGLSLPHPLMPGASPLVDDLGQVRRLEDAGAAAIVMRSLFEEQLALERAAASRQVEHYAESFAEARSLFPGDGGYALGPDKYLEQLHRIKQTVGVPVIASLNGASLGGWLHFARLLQQAGADALELNVYDLPTDAESTGQEVERRVVEMLGAVKRRLSIPVAVKLSPFYSALGHLAVTLDRSGANGLILFNRFYQADIDVEQLEVIRTLQLSDSRELPLRLRWLAILSGRIGASLAVSGGVHDALDAIKAVMSGAHVVQMVSALLQRGPEHLGRVRRAIAEWLEEHEYESLAQMRGSMSLERCPNPAVYARANYVEMLQSWEPR